MTTAEVVDGVAWDVRGDVPAWIGFALGPVAPLHAEPIARRARDAGIRVVVTGDTEKPYLLCDWCRLVKPDAAIVAAEFGDEAWEHAMGTFGIRVLRLEGTRAVETRASLAEHRRRHPEPGARAWVVTRGERPEPGADAWWPSKATGADPA